MKPVVVVVMGVSGSGKSTIAGLVAERLRWDLLEGDELHPKANIEKMSHGIPLTDDDRRPWLGAIARWIDERIRTGRPALVTCSSLKRSYRDILRARLGVPCLGILEHGAARISPDPVPALRALLADLRRA